MHSSSSNKAKKWLKFCSVTAAVRLKFDKKYSKTKIENIFFSPAHQQQQTISFEYQIEWFWERGRFISFLITSFWFTFVFFFFVYISLWIKKKHIFSLFLHQIMYFFVFICLFSTVYSFVFFLFQNRRNNVCVCALWYTFNECFFCLLSYSCLLGVQEYARVYLSCITIWRTYIIFKDHLILCVA